jgi:hypothetical protein
MPHAAHDQSAVTLDADGVIFGFGQVGEFIGPSHEFSDRSRHRQSSLGAKARRRSRTTTIGSFIGGTPPGYGV